MGDKEREIHEFFERSRLTLDLAGLTDEERQAGSVFLGGSAAEFVESVENFQYDRIETVVFRWGDDKAKDIFAALLEHIESPDETILPFTAAAIVGGNIWLLTLQDKDFSTEKAYRTTDDFIEVPFDEEEAEEVLANAMASSARKEILGKVGSSYVLFAMATALSGEISEPVETREEVQPIPEKVDDEEVVAILEKIVDEWDFESKTDQANSRFALHLAHWVLETFGHDMGESGWWSSTRYHEEIEGSQLPDKLQLLLTQIWKEEPYVTGDNSVTMQGKPEYMETDPIIPRWEEIEKFETFEEQLEFARSQPDILEGIEPTSITVLPQVSVMFEPQPNYEWGIEFLVNELGIRLASFGRDGKTMEAADFTRVMDGKTSETAKIVCQLVLLCAQFSQSYTGGEIGIEKFEELMERVFAGASISTDSDIFRNIATYKPKPENSIKNLLIRRLQESGDLT